MTGRNNKMRKVMKEFREGRLHSGSDEGPRVKSRKQAIAVEMSEQRKARGRQRSRKRS